MDIVIHQDDQAALSNALKKKCITEVEALCNAKC